MKFETSKKIDKWLERHREKCVAHATPGEQFLDNCGPRRIIECRAVECLCCKEKFTDYVD